MGDDQVFYVGGEPADLAEARDWLGAQLHHSWLLEEESDIRVQFEGLRANAEDADDVLPYRHR